MIDKNLTKIDLKKIDAIIFDFDGVLTDKLCICNPRWQRAS